MTFLKKHLNVITEQVKKMVQIQDLQSCLIKSHFTIQSNNQCSIASPNFPKDYIWILSLTKLNKILLSRFDLTTRNRKELATYRTALSSGRKINLDHKKRRQMAYEAANSYTMAIRVMEFSNFKNSIFASYLLRLPISPILKIQKFHLGILILRQKSF